MIKSKKLSKYKNVSHGFFNRKGGKSKGLYKSLNCGPGSSDKQKNIKNVSHGFFNRKGGKSKGNTC